MKTITPEQLGDYSVKTRQRSRLYEVEDVTANFENGICVFYAKTDKDDSRKGVITKQALYKLMRRLIDAKVKVWYSWRTDKNGKDVLLLFNKEFEGANLYSYSETKE